MKKFVTKFNILLIGYIISFSLFIPIIGFGARLNGKLDSDQEFDSKIDSSILSPLIDINSNKIESNLQLQDIRTIYDESLNSFLDNYSFSESITPEKIQIIILFDEHTSSSYRLGIVDTLFDDYQIINNYHVIPGIALNCNPLELLQKAEIIGEYINIQKIYKSTTFHSPYIIDETPKSSKLDTDFYPNWWINAIGAENLGYDGTGVKVAVIDSGIYNHPDLNIIDQQNFVWDEEVGRIPWDYEDGNGHGTHVAGIIGGNGGGSNGKYRGVAPGVSLINAKAGNAGGGLEAPDIILAIEWCIETVKPDIISMSFGDDFPNAHDPITLALSNASSHGIICVASAGNSGPHFFTGGSPASGVDIISVGATDKYNNLASFSSWGPTTSYLAYPDVVAPGVQIISAEAPNSAISDRQRYLGDFFDFADDGDYVPLSGTSMSCPIVTGAIAILKEAHPTLTPEAARIALIEGAKNINSYDDSDSLIIGAGLINISASLDFLNEINTTYGNASYTAKISPSSLPVQPFDLLNFPGDHQSFNLTVMSGKPGTYNVSIPNNIVGLSLSLDKSQVIFSDPGIDFVALDIEINKDAEPGIRNFELNLTSGVIQNETVDISIEVKLPEYRILMESYHGLNDFYPELSFYQMDFYDAMKDISNLNISLDYGAEYWSPNYNEDTDNSILTEERLAQYDLIVLQNPVLPYSPLEMSNLENYYENGGNILFLGTRYQDLCLENVNDLFSALGVNTTINEENIYNDIWIGIKTKILPQSVTNLNSLSIFQGVDKFFWYYGSSFTTLGDAESIASIGGKTVATAFDGTSQGKGRFVAFGDLHWLKDDYGSTNYYTDHANLLKNLMTYLLPKDNISINIGLPSERTSNPQLNISVFIKDLISDNAFNSATLNSLLNVSIENSTFFEIIQMNSSKDGIATNFTYLLPSPSSVPYTINVNFTYGSTTYNKSSAILFFDNSQIPLITLFSITPSATRVGSDPLDISATLSGPNYNTEAYLSIYTYSFYNSKKTVNKTLPLSRIGPLHYTSYFPSSNDPSGFAIVYIIPTNPISNYINPYSPRLASIVINNDPEFIEENSIMTIGDSILTFDETHDIDDNPYIIPAAQGNNLDFSVQVSESVNYEDLDSSNMRVLISLFICSVNDGTLNIIFPESVPSGELIHQPSTDKHEEIFKIPRKISYSSLTGEKLISSHTNYDTDLNLGYLAILLITAFDSDGGSVDFVIVLQISQSLDLLLLLILIGIFALIGIIAFVVIIRRKSGKAKKAKLYQTDYYDRTAEEVWGTYPASERSFEETEFQVKNANYCQYCGYPIKKQKNFCSNCGKSLVL